MIARVTWIVSLLALALLTAGVQIDKQSEYAPGLARLVPGPLRNYGQVHIVREALQGSDPAKALEEAERLVRRRPLPAEYLTLLAAAQIKAGQTEKGLATIQLSGKRGWREPAAQEAVLRLALASGDKAEAARRYAALFLRPRTPDRLLVELGPAVFTEDDPTAQRTLVAIVVGGERWHSVFLRRGVQVLPPADFAEIAAASLEQGAVFDCRSLETSITQLKLKDAAAAVRLARAGAKSCPKAAALAL